MNKYDPKLTSPAVDVTYNAIVHTVLSPTYVTITTLIFSICTFRYSISLYICIFFNMCVFFAFYVPVSGCSFWL